MKIDIEQWCVWLAERLVILLTRGKSDLIFSVFIGLTDRISTPHTKEVSDYFYQVWKSASRITSDLH